MGTKEPKKKNPLLEEEVGNEETTEENETETVKEKKSVPNTESKKVVPAILSNKTAESQLKSDIQITKEALEKDEKVHFMVPLADGERAGAVQEVWINGYKTTVKKGVMTMIPMTVAKLLAQSYQITSEAGADFRLDLNDAKADAIL